MPFEIEFTQTAANHVRAYRKFEQQIVLDAIGEQLPHEATTETRNRKRLGENELSNWELRVQKFRVFYDVLHEEDRRRAGGSVRDPGRPGLDAQGAR